jgi:hypothetical protein
MRCMAALDSPSELIDELVKRALDKVSRGGPDQGLLKVLGGLAQAGKRVAVIPAYHPEGPTGLVKRPSSTNTTEGRDLWNAGFERFLLTDDEAMDSLLYPTRGAELHLPLAPQGSPLNAQVLVDDALVAEEPYSTWAERKAIPLPDSPLRSKFEQLGDWLFEAGTMVPGIPAFIGLFKKLLGTGWRDAHLDVDRKDLAVRLAKLDGEPSAQIRANAASLTVVRPPWAGIALDIAAFAVEELLPYPDQRGKQLRIDKWKRNLVSKRLDGRVDAAAQLHRLEAPFGLWRFLNDDDLVVR